jgi:hypothetical protein
VVSAIRSERYISRSLLKVVYFLAIPGFL